MVLELYVTIRVYDVLFTVRRRAIARYMLWSCRKQRRTIGGVGKSDWVVG